MPKVYHAGDKVIDMCEPFVIQLDDEHYDIRCHYCMKIRNTLKSCGQCGMVKYCSRECQLNDWKEIHKFNECKLLKANHDHHYKYRKDDRIIARLVLKVTFDPKSREIAFRMWDKSQRRVDDLMSHLDKIDPAQHLDAAFSCQHLVVKINRLFNVKLDIAEVWQLFGIIKINSMKVCDKEQIPYAKALYIEGSAFDHDCRPSCARWYSGRKLQVRAVRTINTSIEQPTISYIDWRKDRDNRRKELAENYFFECQCKRCVNNDDSDVDFKKYQKLMETCGQFRFDDSESWNEILRYERRLIGPHYPDITNAIFKKFLAIGHRIRLQMRSHQKVAAPVAKKWRDLSKEMEREFLITHGTDHPDYILMAENLRQVEYVTKAFRL